MFFSLIFDSSAQLKTKERQIIENENFIMTVNLRGMPGLPTFLQQQKNINIITVTTDATTGTKTKKILKKTLKIYIFHQWVGSNF